MARRAGGLAHRDHIAVPHDGAVLEHHHMTGQTQDVFEVVADKHHRHIELIAQPLKIRQQLAATRHINGRQRLIQQQQARL